MTTELGSLSTRGFSGARGSTIPSESNKRHRGDEAPSQRKRATTACALCRRRKAKCDNARPQCGFCKLQKAVCQYEDDSTEAPRFDPASQEILERLDELKSILTYNTTALVPLESLDKLPSTELRQTAQPSTADQPTHGLLSSQHQRGGGNDSASRGTQPEGPQTSPESLLRWPILREVIAENVSCMKSFLFDGVSLVLGSEHINNHSALRNETPQGRMAARQNINEDDMMRLCSKFIQLIHPRNPILDTECLLNTARQVAEHGLTWDASSCLLLIVCGIACLTIPWATPEYFEHPYEQAWSPNVVLEEKSVAEAYFQASRKRIGLLDDSMTSVQCLFFASVYEKHAMRPIEACHYIQQGISRLQVLRLRRRDVNLGSDGELSEDRLFWSLFKAERYLQLYPVSTDRVLTVNSELLPEVGLPRVWPQSGDPREALPAPPIHTSSVHTLNDNATSESDERGWYFYLAEISLRRRIEDTIAVMYEHTEAHWTHHQRMLISRYDECKRQVDLCHSYLHPCVQFSDTTFPSNELSFYLRGRFYEWRMLLLRPFLYCTVNSPPDSCLPEFESLAIEYLNLCGENITHLSYNGRHGGTWFACRSAFSCALPLLAGVLSNNEAFRLPNWLYLVQLSLRTLARWAAEAQDVEAMHVVLDSALNEVCKRVNLEEATS